MAGKNIAVSAASHLTGGQVKELQDRLLTERKRLLAEYEEEVSSAKDMAADSTGDIVDQAASSWSRELHFSAGDQDRERLRLIEEALQRLDEGTYGACLRSGEPIPYLRLEAIPWARYTADIQEQIEQGLLSEDDD